MLTAVSVLSTVVVAEAVVTVAALAVAAISVTALRAKDDSAYRASLPKWFTNWIER